MAGTWWQCYAVAVNIDAVTSMQRQTMYGQPGLSFTGAGLSNFFVACNTAAEADEAYAAILGSQTVVT